MDKLGRFAIYFFREGAEKVFYIFFAVLVGLIIVLNTISGILSLIAS
jgi:hypothetical protein